MIRTDIHRPSVIEPADYSFVAVERTQSTGNIALDCEAIRASRATIQAHMLKTGGNYSTHEHGGVCMVCGNVFAMYTSLFYHAKSNSYVRFGSDCTEKVFGCDFGMNRFRTACNAAIEHQAGKAKAQAILTELGYGQAWDIYSGSGDRTPYEESTICDIVGKLVKYGSFASDSQKNYVGKMLARIAERPAKAAAKAAELALAADCPTGRIVIEGEVLTTKLQDSMYGTTLKMLVKHASGYKVWGTVPSSISVDKGDKVTFTATVEPSTDDKKFGFFSRPTKATVVEAQVAA